MDILIENLFQGVDCSKFKIPAFFVRSTAPTNVDDESEGLTPDTEQPTIDDIVKILYKNSRTSDDLGLVIAIHGYNTGTAKPSDLDSQREYWYKPLSNYVNQDAFINQKSSCSVFLGYRWPSESLKQKSIRKDAFEALPVLLKTLLFTGILVALIATVLLLFQHILWLVIFTLIGTFAATIVLTLYLLRISVYFRDTSRATSYGVPDLVEVIRQIDQGLISCRMFENFNEAGVFPRIANLPEVQAIDSQVLQENLKKIFDFALRYDFLLMRDDLDLQNPKLQRLYEALRQDIDPTIPDETLQKIIQELLDIKSLEYRKSERYWERRRIKLSFIGHSMGGHVTTQVIRILSDVFDPRSIGKLGNMQPEKTPSSRVGRAFELGRLVLVSPDITSTAITSGRSNSLRSALRRFEEAYLFSNEGDLALRVASTAANYFSFPSRTRKTGYRLGNLTVTPKNRTTVKSDEEKTDQKGIYGIVNLAELPDPHSRVSPYLELNDLSSSRTRRLNEEEKDSELIADLFTYFDCTEYRDRVGDRDAYVLILDNQRSPLKLFAYLRLFVAYATEKRDVHGGYFHGEFAKLLMYRLAFVGFAGLLDSVLMLKPETCFIRNAPDSALQADLDRVLQLDPIQDLQERRKVALRYFAWLCEQKQLQVAVSPERYQVDIMQNDRGVTRGAMLVEKSL